MKHRRGTAVDNGRDSINNDLVQRYKDAIRQFQDKCDLNRLLCDFVFDEANQRHDATLEVIKLADEISTTASHVAILGMQIALTTRS